MKNIFQSMASLKHFRSFSPVFSTASGALTLLAFLTMIPLSESFGQSAQVNLSPAQLRATERNWIFDQNTRMNFGVSGSTTATISAFGSQNNGIGEGFCTATDVDGNLVFYSSATQTYNRNGAATANGSITGNNSATQGVIILPHLKNPDRYLVVYSGTNVGTAPNGNLQYAEYDIKQNGGLGDLVVKNLAPSPTGTNVLASEAITYAPNSTGDGFWVVTYQNNSTQVKAIQVKFPTAATVSFSMPVISNLSSVTYNGYGSMEFNNSWSKALLLTGSFPTGNPGGKLFELNFNALTGVFTESWSIQLPILTGAGDKYYTADYSPAESYAYVGTVVANRLYRYNISSGNGATILGTQEQRTVAISGALRTGPNGRTYAVSYTNPTILEIENPDNATLAGATITAKSRNGGNVSFGLSQTALLIAVDHGDAPSSYKVLASDDGPRHIIKYNTSGTALLTLGTSVTSEPAGVASTFANGDVDNGVASFPTITATTSASVLPSYTVSVSVRNLTGQNANLAGWMDWNLNGTFDAGERVSAIVAPNATSVNLTWSNVPLPAIGTVAATYARFRISSDDMSLPTGTAASGEVEDYRIVFEAPFSCSNDAFMFQNVTTDMYRLNMATGSSSLVASNINGASATESINGVGYNVKDGYIWGWDNNTNKVAKVYSNGYVEYFTVAGMPADPGFNVGDVDLNGVLYLTTFNTTTIYRVDVDPASPTYLQMLPSLTTTSRIIADWAFNPIDNQLYAITSVTATSPVAGGQLIRYNPVTGTSTVLGTVSGASITATNSGFGAIYFDANGAMYAYADVTGRIYKLENVSSGNLIATLFATSTANLTNNDGARCATALVCTNTAPLPSPSMVSNWCPATTVNLTSLQPPAISGFSYQWRTGPTPSSPLVSNPAVAGAGIYYLFSKQDGVECYSLPSEPVTVTITTCTDTDGDGITDAADIDDDNDGVLDSVESPACYFTATEWNTEDKTAFARVSSGLFTLAPNTDFGKLTDDIGNVAAVQFVTATAQSQLNKELFKVEFSSPLRLDAWYIQKANATQISGGNVMLQGSNDNSTWTDLFTAAANPANATNVTANGGVSLANSNKFTVATNAASYRYYRIYGVAAANVLAGIATEMYFDVHTASYQASYFPETTCTNDTDGDGIVNQLDSDSDGDGCSDALEAGATTNTAPGYTFTGPYGANGLANSLETSSESGEVNYTSTYDPSALSNSFAPCLDSDTDGILDIDDIDDDNDGA
ncbi:MAG: GEVED domain-containing protein, partial [Bacteroidota bacterium]